MRVLVTGGAGFIGSHTSLLLLEKGYDVIIYDSLINSSEFAIKRIKANLEEKGYEYNLEFINADIRDKKALENIFKHCVL